MACQPTTGRSTAIVKRRINPYCTQVGVFVPIGLLESGEIGPIAKLIYARLCLFAGADGFCWPSIQTLAAAVGVCRSTAKTGLKQLMEAGLVEAEQRHNSTGESETNFYFFLDHPLLHLHHMGRAESDRGRVNPDPPPGQNLTGGRVNSDPKKIHLKDSSTTTTTPVVVDQNDLLQKAKVLLLAWPPAAAAAPAVAEALQQHGQHGADYAAAQIQHAKLNSKTNPPAFLKLALAGDYAGFYATAEAKATAAAAKQVRAAKEAACQAEEDALLPPVTAEEFFSNPQRLTTIDHLEASND